MRIQSHVEVQNLEPDSRGGPEPGLDLAQPHPDRRQEGRRPTSVFLTIVGANAGTGRGDCPHGLFYGFAPTIFKP